MAKNNILIKPIITEKADSLSEELNQYCFVVEKKANKLEIRQAVEEMYNVAVESVNTLIMPSKVKNRNTRSGLVKGKVSSFKKAIVTLEEGEEINFYGDL
ncbi:MAG: 50S ribosomal protein L23 [Bacteroidetes bacterium]|nr:50S ribosomal protein L23 [Bacteroidota bacterium]